MHLREVFHTSPLNFRDGFNIPVANNVWSAAPTQVYSPVPAGNEYGGERDPCGIDIVPELTRSITAQDYGLWPDSIGQEVGWIVTYRDGNNVTQPHGDGLTLAAAFRGGDTIPVFILPRLIEIRQDGSFAWRGIEAIAFSEELFVPTASLGPSIWFNARVAHDHAIGSVLAHELTHILLDPRQPPLWGDNSTAFLHIQTHTGELKLTRQSGSLGPTTLVTATDLNRRYLLQFGAREACRDAQFSRYVRLEFPPTP